jgi:hypothetical protein
VTSLTNAQRIVISHRIAQSLNTGSFNRLLLQPTFRDISLPAECINIVLFVRPSFVSM